jgi:hypothetical protein
MATAMDEGLRSSRVVYRESTCLFCGAPEVTEEHLIAAWIFRAVQRTRRPRINILRQNRKSGEFQDYYGIRQDTAEVSCRSCNNGWMSRLDNAAAEALKPLVRGEAPVLLKAKQQEEVAAWAVKTIMVNDLPLTGGDSLLRAHAPALRREERPPAFIEIWHGPPSLALADGFAAVGVLPHDGTLVLGTSSDAQPVPLRAWSLMLGHCDLLLRPLFRWIPLDDPPPRFERFWPAGKAAVQLKPCRTPLDVSESCVPKPHPSWVTGRRGTASSS